MMRVVKTNHGTCKLLFDVTDLNEKDLGDGVFVNVTTFKLVAKIGVVNGNH